ncbi:MAG: NAD(P)-binding protein, partial [Woeseiaceae bacterium]
MVAPRSKGQRLKIAVVGTGIAGNIAAHRLHPQHDITVFEADSYVGGHSNTVEVPDGDEVRKLDTG